MSGYDEQIYSNPRLGCEVYGATGYGFYATPDDAAAAFPRHETTPTGNPLFVNIAGLTVSKLTAKGFIK